MSAKQDPDHTPTDDPRVELAGGAKETRVTSSAEGDDPVTGSSSTAQAAAEVSATARESAATEATEPTSAELERLRAELAETRERAERYHSNWQRSAADFQNWKRRGDQEKGEAMRLAEATVVGELLRVLDDFERAFQALPPELRKLTWAEGIALIWQKLFAVLQSRGLSSIEALGQDFDPYLHEAVMREEDGDVSEQTSVVAELQRGYRFHERVIRPSLVKVGKPKAETTAAESSEAAEVIDAEPA